MAIGPIVFSNAELLIKYASLNPELAAALDGMSPRQIGRRLARLQGQTIGGLCLVREKQDEHGWIWEWRRTLAAWLYVLTNRRGTARRQDGNQRRVLDRVLADAKITTHHTIYDLRDTFATTQDWGKLPRVSKQLGHASVITTEKHYYKFKPSAATAGYVDRIRGESSHRAPTTD